MHKGGPFELLKERARSLGGQGAGGRRQRGQNRDGQRNRENFLETKDCLARFRQSSFLTCIQLCRFVE